jgi:hypothetical protein
VPLEVLGLTACLGKTKGFRHPCRSEHPRRDKGSEMGQGREGCRRFRGHGRA